VDGLAVGALAVGKAPAYAGPATEPELYINLLVTDRDHAAREKLLRSNNEGDRPSSPRPRTAAGGAARGKQSIGGALLEFARELAEASGKHLLRVDCYAGDDRALVRYYESQGYTATDSITVDTPRGPWPGQILTKRLLRAA
jgi:hypothetical protein